MDAKQNGRYFADDMFRCILIEISLQYLLKVHERTRQYLLDIGSVLHRR